MLSFKKIGQCQNNTLRNFHVGKIVQKCDKNLVYCVLSVKGIGEITYRYESSVYVC